MSLEQEQGVKTLSGQHIIGVMKKLETITKELMRNNIRMLDKLVPDSGVPGFTVDKGDWQILLAPTINPCNPLEKSLKSWN